MNASLTPEKVLPRSLAEIIDNDKKTFEFTKNLVQAHLFSNYPERRAIAARDIKSMWSRNTSVVALEHEDLTWAYLHYAEADTYIFVSKYRTKDPVFEEVPTDEERAFWGKLLKHTK